jgi:7,8-dihydropterin-6-yl-methyl-4-(beta-D-ribofuranosyl)aminobenzene 5'-phosphate synthase
MITLRCILDNTVLRGSALWGEHGVAFWIETPEGCLLFDTGQSGDVLVHNAEWMDIDFRRCDALVLSHAHYDHTGGLKRFLGFCRPGIPLYASPDLFRERFNIKNGEPRSIGLRMSPGDLAQRTTLHLSAESQEILPGVWTTGEISERLSFEGRSAQHYIRVGETWQPDPYQDDLSLVLQTPQGLVVVCGCCHAGLLNTLTHIRRSFSQPLLAIVGGTHLAAAGSEALVHVMIELREWCEGHVPDLYLNHCTGERAMAALVQAFGDKANPCPAGTVLIFDR